MGAVSRHYRKLHKKMKKRKGVGSMLSKVLISVLNGLITFIVLQIIVVILGMVGLGAIGAVIAPFIWAIALLVGVLTFFGAIPNYWSQWIK